MTSKPKTKLQQKKRAREAGSSHPHAPGECAPASLAPAVLPGEPEPAETLVHPKHGAWARLYQGDCRDIISKLASCIKHEVDLVFADPPFNWNRAYDKWDDAMPREDYLKFTAQWLDACTEALRPNGSIWVNIPDDTAAEIVMHLKGRGLEMINWCVWHYRFGQNTTTRFINSKVHALYFAKDPNNRVWRPEEILEISDRASIYFDPRTEKKKDGMPPRKRVPMDVWYGKFWGRVQGNNKERRAYHDNQLPEAYLERVVRACSEPGMLVMDPFLGSGTTGVIAHALGRHFIGTEFSAANLESAAERMRIGPHRLGQSLGQSSAIFPARKTRKK